MNVSNCPYDISEINDHYIAVKFPFDYEMYLVIRKEGGFWSKPDHAFIIHSDNEPIIRLELELRYGPDNEGVYHYCTEQYRAEKELEWFDQWISHNISCKWPKSVDARPSDGIVAICKKVCEARMKLSRRVDEEKRKQDTSIAVEKT